MGIYEGAAVAFSNENKRMQSLRPESTVCYCFVLTGGPILRFYMVV